MFYVNNMLERVTVKNTSWLDSGKHCLELYIYEKFSLVLVNGSYIYDKISNCNIWKFLSVSGSSFIFWTQCKSRAKLIEVCKTNHGVKH